MQMNVTSAFEARQRNYAVIARTADKLSGMLESLEARPFTRLLVNSLETGLHDAVEATQHVLPRLSNRLKALIRLHESPD